MKNILYLGSKSRARHQLLKDAQMDFVIVGQDADESKCDICPSLRETVEKIALYKMEHVILPGLEKGCAGKVGQQEGEGHKDLQAWRGGAPKEGEICFVLTADTLTQNKDGSLSGKPCSREDAIKMIKLARLGATVGTAFCLDKKVWRAGRREVFERVQKYVEASYDLDIEDEWIDVYLEKSFGSVSSGAVAIEGYGEQFLKSINGSHSTIVGLPMFELRRALQELGFFDFL